MIWSPKFTTISQRLKWGIGSLLGLLCLLGGSAVWIVDRTDTSFITYRSIARQTAVAGVLTADIMRARINVRDYLSGGDAEDARTVYTSLVSAHKRIAKEAALFHTADQRARLAAISRDLKRFDQDARAALDLHTQTRARQERLGRLTERLRLTAPDSRAALKAARLAELELALRPDANAIADADTAARALVTSVPASARADALAYQVELRALAKELAQQDRLMRTSLNVVGPRMRKTLDVMITESKAQQDVTGPDIAAKLAWARILIAMGVVVIAVIGAVTGVALARSIIRPIQGLTAAMDRLTSGALDSDTPFQQNQGEIGAMARTVEILKQGLIQNRELHDAQVAAQIREAELIAQREEERQATEAAQQAAQIAAQAERHALLIHTAAEMEMQIGGISQAIASAANQLQVLSHSMTETAARNTEETKAVAAASEQTSNNMQTVASAGQELSMSVSEIRRQMDQSRTASDAAVAEAGKAKEHVQGLTHAATDIGRVVDLINNIAEQTNLLALNATIEAARAGEMGRGFAIVAGEVKVLANQTAQATKDIASKISAIQTASQQSSESIAAIAEKISELSVVSISINGSVEQQGAATDEIARNIQVVSGASDLISQKVAGIGDSSDMVADSAREVLNAAQALATKGEELRSGLDTLITQIRAA